MRHLFVRATKHHRVAVQTYGEGQSGDLGSAGHHVSRMYFLDRLLMDVCTCVFKVCVQYYGYLVVCRYVNTYVCQYSCI